MSAASAIDLSCRWSGVEGFSGGRGGRERLADRGAGSSHIGNGSVWVVISMIVFSLFLLAFAWSLLRPLKTSPPTPADNAAERYAQGKIDADDLERILRDTRSHRH